LQAGGITNGKLPIGVQATGIAPTDPPTITSSCTSSTSCLLQIQPNTGASGTPSGLENLVCTLYRTTALTLMPNCSEANPLYYTYNPTSCPAAPTACLTATITQADGVVSQASSWTAPS
jgi:hypothetical protein